jgi:hypothetical protein
LPAEDLPVIVDIYNSTIASREVTADTEPVTVAVARTWFDDHTPERRPLWVIHDAADTSENPAVIGWMSYSNFYGRPAYSGTAELSIYIAKNGAARARQLLAWSRRWRSRRSVGCTPCSASSSAITRPAWPVPQVRLRDLGEFPRVANLDGIERDLIILGKRVA